MMAIKLKLQSLNAPLLCAHWFLYLLHREKRNKHACHRKRQSKVIGFRRMKALPLYCTTRTTVLVAILVLCLFCFEDARALQPTNSNNLSKPNKVRRVASRIYRPIRNKLWPNTLSDTSHAEQPLPPGPLGCPFKGYNTKQSSPSFGPGVLFYTLFERLQRPRIFKLFSKNKGIVIVSGYANTKTVLSQEFDTVVSQVVPFTSKFIGTNSLRFSQDKQEHATLRKLVGMALQPSRVSKMIPSLQETAEDLVDETLSASRSNNDTSTTTFTTIQMEDICLKYTLSIALRHIIGLDDYFTREEADHFLQQVKTWIGALYAKPNEDARWQQAREYLVDKIEAKIQILEANGPDESTVSGMLFGTDPGDPKQLRLTRDEIIDNTLLLIFAGSETSASTLTNCLLLLGLNKLKNKRGDNQNTRETAWSEVTQEQEKAIQKYGTHQLNRTILESAAYLDGVVRESLRIKPIVGGSMRGTKATIVVDGYQIPAGWGVSYDRYNTHVLDPTTFRDDLSHMNIIQGFDPTRWYNTDTTINGQSTIPGQEWIPFGAGPRYCLGSDLAMVEMKTFLAVLARKMTDFDLVYPSVQDVFWGTDDIPLRQTGIIPVPEKGVVIRPKISNKTSKRDILLNV
jgi:cytochrome P450